MPLKKKQKKKKAKAIKKYTRLQATIVMMESPGKILKDESGEYIRFDVENSTFECVTSLLPEEGYDTPQWSSIEGAPNSTSYIEAEAPDSIEDAINAFGCQSYNVRNLLKVMEVI